MRSIIPFNNYFVNRVLSQRERVLMGMQSAFWRANTRAYTLHYNILLSLYI